MPQDATHEMVDCCARRGLATLVQPKSGTMPKIQLDAFDESGALVVVMVQADVPNTYAIRVRTTRTAPRPDGPDAPGMRVDQLRLPAYHVSPVIGCLARQSGAKRVPPGQPRADARSSRQPAPRPTLEVISVPAFFRDIGPFAGHRTNRRARLPVERHVRNRQVEKLPRLKGLRQFPANQRSLGVCISGEMVPPT